MLSERTKKILHTVRTLEPADRFTLQSRLQEEDFNEAGVETALIRLARHGYLDKTLNYNHVAPARSRHRNVYLLGPKGRAFFGISGDYELKRALRRREGWNLHHDCGVSRFTAYLLNCSDRGYCQVKWQEAKQIDTADGANRPDRFFQVDGFGFFFEYERHNKYSRAVLHAKRYWRAYQDEVIDEPVLFVSQHRERLAHIREHIESELGDTGNFFRYLSERDFDLFTPSKAVVESITAPLVLD